MRVKRRLGATLALALVTACAAASAQIVQSDLDLSLIDAARQGNLATYRLALGLGANEHAYDRTGNNAVVMAAYGDNELLLRDLLDRGVNPNAIGNLGFTALTVAVARGRHATVRLLLRHGARADIANARGESPLHLAIKLARNDMIPELLAAGAHLNSVNADGESPLISAVRSDNSPALRLLLDRRPNLDLADRTDRTALFWALIEGREAMAVTLVEAGAVFGRDFDGYSPLKLARIMGQEKAVGALLEKGARE